MTVSPQDGRLRDAFAALAEAAPTDGEVDVERIWKAVRGDLPAAERREVVDLVSRDPSAAEVWRLAHELSSPESASAPATSGPSWRHRWLAVAAALLVALGAAVVSWRFADLPGERPEAEYREPSSSAILSTLDDGASLSRDDARLGWSSRVPAERYRVRVTTEDLRVVADVQGLESEELVLSQSLLDELPSGTVLLWQVDAIAADGAVSSSVTFRNVLE